MRKPQTGCYLLHYTRPLASGKGYTKHYLGMARDLNKRIDKHRRGTSGAALPMAFHTNGITFRIGRKWVTDTIKEAYLLERQLKARKNSPQLCMICRRNKRRRIKRRKENK